MLNSARYKAFLTAGSSGTLTPDFTKVQLTHGGTSTSMLQVFAFDAAGNMTSKTTETASGTSTDVRDDAGWSAGDRINDLNQVKKQVVTPAGGSAVTWTYSYNSNGCMTSKTNGTDTWTYTWDDDNRLTRVQGPGGVDVSYSYDSLGRMLTRTSGGVTTKFTWDGWNCVKEDDGTNVFRWYCPEGELHSFERNSAFYQVHSDALGSVRAITDADGDVVGSYTYGAWGETTSASHPSGFTMPYLFVGAWGVRFDPTTGLHYMRNRWYDAAGLQRFLSRDPLHKPQCQYLYVDNSPVRFIDPLGLDRCDDVAEEIKELLRETNDLLHESIRWRELSLQAQGSQRRLSNLATSWLANPLADPMFPDRSIGLTISDVVDRLNHINERFRRLNLRMESMIDWFLANCPPDDPDFNYFKTLKRNICITERQQEEVIRKFENRHNEELRESILLGAISLMVLRSILAHPVTTTSLSPGSNIPRSLPKASGF